MRIRPAGAGLGNGGNGRNLVSLVVSVLEKVRFSFEVSAGFCRFWLGLNSGNPLESRNIAGALPHLRAVF